MPTLSKNTVSANSTKNWTICIRKLSLKTVLIKKICVALACLVLIVFLSKFFNYCDKSNERAQPEKFKYNRLASVMKWIGKTFFLYAGLFAISENENRPNALGTNKNETGYFGGKALVTINVTDWKRTDMQTLSATQIMDYFLWSNQSSCQVIQHFGGVMVSTARGLVSLEGQKALCLDHTVRPIGAINGVPGRCLVYSFGINNEWSFDDAMELYGCEIFSFDPSMNVFNHNRTENIHFYRMALGDVDKDGWENCTDVPTRTLLSIYNMLSPMHGKDAIIDYLKIDIEFAEWQILPQIMKSGILDKVRQLAVEIHVNINKSFKECRQQAVVLQWLENCGMIRFDSKPNVNTWVSLPHTIQSTSVFNGYEIAWYNNKLLRVS